MQRTLLILSFSCVLILCELLANGPEGQAVAAPEPSFGRQAGAATETSATDPEILGLAEQLADSLHNAGAKRILVLDLQGPQGEIHPIGKWLAEQFSVALQKAAPHLEEIGRTEIKDQAVSGQPSGEPAPFQSERALALGHSLGADAVIFGSFAKKEQRLSITLRAAVPGGPRAYLKPVFGSIAISERIAAISAEPMPVAKGPVRAGVGGVTNPGCEFCPTPDYSDQARRKHIEGTVTLDVTVTTDGRASDALVVKGPGYGLEEKAIAAVKNWQFRPALDASGSPVTARVIIQVSFKLYNNK